MAPKDFPSETFAATRAHRPNVMATRHVVAGGHPWTAQAGFEILEAGGNAFDAGVAMGIATNVLESHFTSFSGVAPSLLYSAERREVVAISGVGVWPKAASVAFFRDNHEGRIEGIWNGIVPGAPDTWLTVLEEFGTMSFADVAGAAIRFAREGFSMYPFMAHIIETTADQYRRWPSNAAIYLPQGRPPKVGEMFVQADLATTLQYLADEESAHRSDGRKAGIEVVRRAFYAGDVATRFARFHADNGGLLTAEDMAGFRMRFEPPSRIRTRGIDVYAGGPYSQGPSMLQALAIVEGFELAAMGHNSADYAHTLLEAFKLVAADR
ncbi:MAG: gamma-glutamyltransferase, partial [Rhodospirillales bacterium]|nr:gamma-glutamyltransferase [Rhodospirillales bacterium]